MEAAWNLTNETSLLLAAYPTTTTTLPPHQRLKGVCQGTNLTRDACPIDQEMCRVLETKLEGLRYAFAGMPTVGVLVTTLYISVITVGAIGNFLVIASVLRNVAMRTPRNLFIVNLALSDLLLCVLTVPFNMKMILVLYWDLGQIACNVVSTAQGVNIFVSTMSIAAIALDRYLVILFPTNRAHQRTLMISILVLVWGLSILFASPYFFVTAVVTVFNNNRKLVYALEQCSLASRYAICKEEVEELWPQMPISSNFYTVFCFAFQYFLPLFATAFVYTRIGCRMRARLRGNSRQGGDERRRSVQKRHRRTNILLISLVVIFATAWLPLNIYNTLIVIKGVQYNLTTFTFCHIAGMMSAAANPILYGVFNDNFRTEFELIFEQLKILPLLRGMRNCVVLLLCPAKAVRRASSAVAATNHTTKVCESRLSPPTAFPVSSAIGSSALHSTAMDGGGAGEGPGEATRTVSLCRNGGPEAPGDVESRPLTADDEEVML